MNRLPISEFNKLMVYVSDTTPIDMVTFKRMMTILEEDGGVDFFRPITCLHNITLVLPALEQAVEVLTGLEKKI